MLDNTPKKIVPTGALCPCGKAPRTELERISRGYFVKTFLFWIPLRHYKCYKCKRKRWVLRPGTRENSIA